ncbi:MAG TPA: response regulator [Gemmataceae bacterium]|nr:response regulator [Gemmataceae bacterium]
MTPGKYVLVIEDNALVRDAVTQLLRSKGYQVVAAANGREALDRLRSAGPPSVILLDLSMPVMGGRQFLQEQRREPAWASVPVVVLAGAAEPVPSGIAEYLVKPVGPQEVLEAIRRTIERGPRPV